MFCSKGIEGCYKKFVDTLDKKGVKDAFEYLLDQPEKKDPITVALWNHKDKNQVYMRPYAIEYDRKKETVSLFRECGISIPHQVKYYETVIKPFESDLFDGFYETLNKSGEAEAVQYLYKNRPQEPYYERSSEIPWDRKSKLCNFISYNEYVAVYNVQFRFVGLYEVQVNTDEIKELIAAIARREWAKANPTLKRGELGNYKPYSLPESVDTLLELEQRALRCEADMREVGQNLCYVKNKEAM